MADQLDELVTYIRTTDHSLYEHRVLTQSLPDLDKDIDAPYIDICDVAEALKERLNKNPAYPVDYSIDVCRRQHTFIRIMIGVSLGEHKDIFYARIDVFVKNGVLGLEKTEITGKEGKMFDTRSLNYLHKALLGFGGESHVLLKFNLQRGTDASSLASHHQRYLERAGYSVNYLLSKDYRAEMILRKGIQELTLIYAKQTTSAPFKIEVR